MKIFAKKKTEAYCNGKLVNTIERSMTEGQYHKDLAERLLDSVRMSGHKVKVEQRYSSGTKVEKLTESAIDRSNGKRYRYVTRYTFPEKREKARKK